MLSLPANSEVSTHMLREVIHGVIFEILKLCVVHDIKKNLGLQVVLLMEDELPDDGKM